MFNDANYHIRFIHTSLSSEKKKTLIQKTTKNGFKQNEFLANSQMHGIIG